MTMSSPSPNPIPNPGPSPTLVADLQQFILAQNMVFLFTPNNHKQEWSLRPGHWQGEEVRCFPYHCETVLSCFVCQFGGT